MCAFTIEILSHDLAGGRLPIICVRSSRFLINNRCVFGVTSGPQRGAVDNCSDKKPCFRGTIYAKVTIAINIATIKTQITGIAEADVLLRKRTLCVRISLPL